MHLVVEHLSPQLLLKVPNYQNQAKKLCLKLKLESLSRFRKIRKKIIKKKGSSVQSA